ncbi:MAG: hypothetical protein IPQ07_43315 [Myxococcales bacterium]|nr:hypothetical protein [Myxococcales bacterium]
MLTFDSLPQARVVRTGGQLMTPPRAPPPPRSPMNERMREALAVAVGLWPLTGVMLLAFALLALAGLYSSP